MLNMPLLHATEGLELHRFEHKLPHTNALSVSERQAVIAFISVNVEEFGVLAQFGRPLEVLKLPTPLGTGSNIR